MNDTLKLTQALINRPSITPEDAGCQRLISESLQALGFNANHLRFGEVDNLWITHGHLKPLFTFAGHTDVVPSGQMEHWQSKPFNAEIRGTHLYGRGAADMKSGIAAMAVAAKRFVEQYPNHKGTIALLLTSDEEGPSINGTCKVIEYLNKKNIKIDWCVIGEPSSHKQLGDMIRIGRRGSLNGILTINGIQGHVAYPEFANNPIHSASAFLSELTSIEWDQGNHSFPPTTLQISNINGGTGAENIIPDNLRLLFNFRYSTEMTDEKLKHKVIQLLDSYHLDYELQWKLSGLPFLTTSDTLIDVARKAVKKICHIDAKCSTGGGTSDGRFISPTGAEVIELGMVNETIHKVNECVKIDDLEPLTDIYQNILEQFLID